MQSESGTLLVEGGLISESQLQQALTAAVRTGGGLVQNLIRLGFLTDRQLAEFFSSRLQIPLAERAQFENLPAFITRLVPADLVMSHRAVPIMLHQGVLHMAMSDPTSRSAVEEISFVTGYSAAAVAAPDSLVEEAMARYYGIPPEERLVEQGPDSPMWKPVAIDSGTFSAAPPPTLEMQVAEGTEGFELLRPKGTDEPVEEPSDLPSRSEFATGELEELFGLSRSEEEVIHLTRRKGELEIDGAPSIADAIRLQVQGPEVELPGTEATAFDLPEQPEPVTPESQESAFSSESTEVWQGEPESLPESLPESEPEQAPSYSDQPWTDQTESPEPVFSSQAAPPAPATWEDLPPLHNVEQARQLIIDARDRDEIARILVRFSRSFMPRVIMFIVKKDILVGWLGAGEGVLPRQVKGIMIPLNSPSVFRTVRETCTDYFGSLPHTTVNDLFISAIGEIEPRQILLIPISVRHKPICILYGDCGREPGFSRDLSPIHLLVQDASAAFEKIILERKMGRLVQR